MIRKVRLVLSTLVVVCGAIVTGVAEPALAENYLLIINANNAFSGDPGAMKTVVKRLYLRQITDWPNSEKGNPFGRPSDSAAHRAFAKGVLGMTEAQLQAHWSRLKQTTGETPPREVEKSRVLLRQIARKKGAFSVIAKSEARKLPARVRVLFRFSE